MVGMGTFVAKVASDWRRDAVFISNIVTNILYIQ